MRSDHYFDWHGFKFAIKLLVLAVVGGTLGRYGLLYAAQSHAPAPSVVLIQETKPAQRSLSLSLSTTTSTHIIHTLFIADTIPPTGKFISADLVNMVLTLYQDGSAIAKYPILAKAAPGSLHKVPAGIYRVLDKDADRFDRRDLIDAPWSIRLSANYFINGWPHYDDGSLVDTTYGGDGIRLSADDAKKVFDFSEEEVDVFVYDPVRTTTVPSLVLGAVAAPTLTASSYLVADLDTGDVLLEQNAGALLPIYSLTKLMTALVAEETVPLDTPVDVSGSAVAARETGNKKKDLEEAFRVEDLMYPLLMNSNDAVARKIISLSAIDFVAWMNEKTGTLGMQSTRFADATGTTTENVSTADDLFRFAAYLANEKSRLLDIAATESQDIESDNGTKYAIKLSYAPANALGVVSIPIAGRERRAALIVLDSLHPETEKNALAFWYKQSVEQGAEMASVACATCSMPPLYRKIRF